MMKKGFTLTEITIVIAIFSLVIATVYLIFALNQRVYLAGEEMAEITQNGRVVLERITKEIRQAKEIVTELSEERTGSVNEIIFQNGHLPLVSEEDTAQGGTSSTITLASTASDDDDYYKDMFIRIIEGTGAGQTGKIYKYNGATKVVEIEGSWDTNPGSGSIYKIDTSYYYIRYYRDNNHVLREIFTYCFSEDGETCDSSETYCSWDTDAILAKIILENPRIIGEYVATLEFWGLYTINIFITLNKSNQEIDLSTKVFGRNL